MSDGPFEALADGVLVSVRVTPRASRTAIQGLAREADGTLVVKASVTAVPEDGKANAALVALLAKAWRVPRSSLAVATGATDRRKRLKLAGPSGDLLERLGAWTKTLPQV